MNKSKAKFSILMANYNNGRYIKEAINSVLIQTYDNWELIIVDDASSDNSLELIMPYLKDKRIKLVKHKENLGYGAAEKSCTENVSGKIWGVLDSDDVLDKEAVEIMVRAYEENPTCGFIYSTFYYCDDKLKIKGIAGWTGEVKKGKTNLHQAKILHFRTFKKSAYQKTKGFDPWFKKAVDKDIIYKLEEVTKLKFINKPLYYYRKHNKNISLGKQNAEARIYEVSAKYNAYKRRLNTNIPNLTDQEMSTEFLSAFLQSIKSRNSKKMRHFLRKAIKLYPFNFIGYTKMLLRIIKFPFYRIYRKIKPGCDIY